MNRNKIADWSRLRSNVAGRKQWFEEREKRWFEEREKQWFEERYIALVFWYQFTKRQT